MKIKKKKLFLVITGKVSQTQCKAMKLVTCKNVSFPLKVSPVPRPSELADITEPNLNALLLKPWPVVLPDPIRLDMANRAERTFFPPDRHRTTHMGPIRLCRPSDAHGLHTASGKCLRNH